MRLIVAIKELQAQDWPQEDYAQNEWDI